MTWHLLVPGATVLLWLAHARAPTQRRFQALADRPVVLGHSPAR